MPLPARLYIVRHGIAEPHGTPGVPDSQRPLTPKGEARMKEIAEGLKRLDLAVQRVVTSPLPRALRTAEIVVKGLGLPEHLEVSETLTAGAAPRALREWLEARSEERLMVVGHNPDLTDLVALLLGLSAPVPPFDLKKGGVAALAAGADGGYALEWLATPGLFRRLGD